MSAAKTNMAAATLMLAAAIACGHLSARTGAPSPVTNSAPRVGDSVMTTGPYAGATPRMTCVPDLRALEVGDFVRCSVDVRLLGERGPTSVQVASNPELRTSTPNVLAITTDGGVVVRGAGVATLWSTVYGATVLGNGQALPRVASLRFEPFISDTTLHVGDTLRIRVMALDDNGHEMSVARELTVVSSASPLAGTLKRVDSSARWVFVATAPGLAEFWVSRLRHLAHVTIRIDSAPANVVAKAPRPREGTYEWAPGAGRRVNVVPTVGVLVTRGGQDVRLPRAGVTLDPNGPLAFTDSGGFVRFRDVEPGHRMIRVTCPVSRRLRGREMVKQVVEVTPTTDTIIALTIPADQCIEPPETTVRGTFIGHYTAGFQASTFRPCKAFAAPRGSAYDAREAVALAVFDDDVFARRSSTLLADTLNDLHPTFYVRWTGTLTGPGSYGHLGADEYILHVERVLQIRLPTPRDCR